MILLVAIKREFFSIWKRLGSDLAKICTRLCNFTEMIYGLRAGIVDNLVPHSAIDSKHPISETMIGIFTVIF